MAGPAPSMPAVPLGASGIEVSRLALGSWRTFERISRERAVSVMRAAQDAGVTFLDDARYNDETGAAPMPTGYSEVVFAELFRAAGWRRGDTVVSNKLWWEFWPSQSPREEIAGSLGRMGLDYLDLIYSERPPAGVPLAEVVGLITELVSSGLARSWGTLNWTAAQMAHAWELADAARVPGPVATQPPYSLITRQFVEDPEMTRVAADRGIAIVASYTLAGGVLTGKYASDPAAGRAAGQLDQPRYAAGAEAGVQLAALAAEVGCEPAQLAMAFALLNPAVTTVLFGATSPEQVAVNVGSLAVADSLPADAIARLRAIGAS